MISKRNRRWVPRTTICIPQAYTCISYDERIYSIYRMHVFQKDYIAKILKMWLSGLGRGVNL